MRHSICTSLIHRPTQSSFFLACLWFTIAASTALAVDPKPPKPNPYKPVDYIEWYNRTMGADVKENAADVYQQAQDVSTVFECEWGETLTRPWRDQEYPAIAAWLDRNARAMELFRKAAAMKECFFALEAPTNARGEQVKPSLIQAMIPCLSGYGNLGKGLIADGFRKCVADDRRTLISNIASLLRSSQHLCDGSTLIHRLGGISLARLAYETTLHALDHVGARDSFSADVLSALQNLDPPRHALKNMYFMERLIGRDNCQRCFIPSGDNLLIPDPSLARVMDGNDFKRIEAIGYFATLRESESIYNALDAWLTSSTGWIGQDKRRIDRMVNESANPLVRKFLGSDTRFRVLAEIGSASRRGTLLTLHLFIYHQQRGHFPETLDELAMPDLTTVRIDPFSGKDFIYHRRGDAFILYSVAENLRDDGGIHNEDWKKGDFVFWPVMAPEPARTKSKPASMLGRIYQSFRAASRPVN